MQAFLFEILGPIFRSTPECSELYAPGRPPAAARASAARCPSWATCSTGSAPRARASSTTVTWRGACSDWVLERGGLLTREDLAAYGVVEREPARVSYQGREVLTNPPPSSGGILIADALGILERLDAPARRRRDGRGDRLHQPGARRGVPRRAGPARATWSVPAQGRARHVAHRGALAARQHDAHLGAGRRGRLRDGHVLERLVLGRGGARHRACTSTTCWASRT